MAELFEMPTPKGFLVRLRNRWAPVRTIGFKRFDTATVTIRRIELAETEKIKFSISKA
jgi:hypothetical protein